MYLVIPWLTHGYVLLLKINTSAISPQFLPGRKVLLPCSAHGRGEIPFYQGESQP